MAVPLPISAANSTAPAPFRPVYTGVIAFVAALGGLLFGYDWVVIGGAKPFYEVFFRLTSAPVRLNVSSEENTHRGTGWDLLSSMR